MCAGHFCRLLDLCIGRIQPAIADIFPDRSGKQVRILQHHCDITAQVFSSNLADIHAIHQDFSAVDLVKPVDQVRDRRLARAGTADKRDLLSRFRIQGNMLQNRMTRHIAKRHIL